MNPSTTSLLERLRNFLQGTAGGGETSPEQGLLLEGLEPRVLYSASPVEAAEPPPEPAAEAQHIAPIDASILTETTGRTEAAELPALRPELLQEIARRTVPSTDAIALSSFELGELEEAEIASHQSDSVVLDAKATGYGWNLRSTSPSPQGQDLPTTLMHEAAHLTESNLERSPIRKAFDVIGAQN